MGEPCAQEGVIATLVTDVKHIKEDNRQFMSVVQGINDELKEINQKWGQRPSWATTLVITTLATACGSMFVYIALMPK